MGSRSIYVAFTLTAITRSGLKIYLCCFHPHRNNKKRAQDLSMLLSSSPQWQEVDSRSIYVAFILTAITRSGLKIYLCCFHPHRNNKKWAQDLSMLLSSSPQKQEEGSRSIYVAFILTAITRSGLKIYLCCFHPHRNNKKRAQDISMWLSSSPQ